MTHWSDSPTCRGGGALNSFLLPLAGVANALAC